MNTSLLPRLLTILENVWLPKFQPPTDKSVLRVGFVFFRLLKRLYISLSFQSNGMIWIDKKKEKIERKKSDETSKESSKLIMPVTRCSIQLFWTISSLVNKSDTEVPLKHRSRNSCWEMKES